jgi:uncharacterized metal-binding protein
MPSHKTHERINLAALIIAIVGLIYYRFDIIDTAIFSIAFIFGTYYLSPDLDIDSTIYRRWKLARILWCPYKEAFKHRGHSHNIILGPLSLIGYLSFVVLGALYVASRMTIGGFNIESIHQDSLVVIISGLFLAIESHILSDMILSKNKKKKK